jgi:hypothetical protein
MKYQSIFEHHVQTYLKITSDWFRSFNVLSFSSLEGALKSTKCKKNLQLTHPHPRNWHEKQSIVHIQVLVIDWHWWFCCFISFIVLCVVCWWDRRGRARENQCLHRYYNESLYGSCVWLGSRRRESCALLLLLLFIDHSFILLSFPNIPCKITVDRLQISLVIR